MWDNKPPRIRYNRLIQGYQEGGLKLVDLKAREITLKAKWPLYFKDRDLPWLYFDAPIKDHHIWEANTQAKHVQQIAKQEKSTSIFYQLWLAWSEINFKTPTMIAQVQTQRLWGNSFYLKSRTSFFP